MASSAPDHLRTPGLISNRPCYEGIKVGLASAGAFFDVRYATSGVELTRDIEPFAEAVTAPIGGLVHGQQFTLTLDIGNLPLQDTNGDGALSTADINVTIAGRTAANTPIVTSIGGTAILANPANGLASADQLTLVHSGDALAGGTEISVSYLGLVDLVTVKGDLGVDMPLRMRETGPDTGVFQATVIAIGSSFLDQPNSNLDPTATGDADRPRLAVFDGGLITVTYRDRAPLRIVTAEVEVWLVPPTILVAEFSGAPRGGLAPLTVSFADESTISTGAITVWKWDFGDGAISTGQNPTHVYQALGSYAVSLAVTGDGTGDTLTKADYIQVFEVTGQRFSELPIEVLRERIQRSGSFDWQPTGVFVELETWDSVVVELTVHSGASEHLYVGLSFPGPDRAVLNSRDFAFEQLEYNQDQGKTFTRAIIAPISGPYQLMVHNFGSSVDFSIVVTRYIPFIAAPVVGDVNGDKVVDVLDLAIVALNLSRP